MPAALPVIAIASTVIGGAVSAFGAIKQGQAASASAQYQAEVAKRNAETAQQNATYATQASNAKASQQLLANAQQQGRLRAALGASGLDVESGSAADVQQGQKITSALDVLTIRNQGARQAYGYQTQSSGFQAEAGLDTMRADAAKSAGMMGAFGSLLGSASSLGDKFMNFNRAGVSLT